MSASELQKAAFAAGGIAHAAGEPLTACPHAAGAGEGLRTLWIRGWVRAEDAAGASPLVLDEPIAVEA